MLSRTYAQSHTSESDCGLEDNRIKFLLFFSFFCAKQGSLHPTLPVTWNFELFKRLEFAKIICIILLRLKRRLYWKHECLSSLSLNQTHPKSNEEKRNVLVNFPTRYVFMDKIYKLQDLFYTLLCFRHIVR